MRHAGPTHVSRRCVMSARRLASAEGLADGDARSLPGPPANYKIVVGGSELHQIHRAKPNAPYLLSPASRGRRSPRGCPAAVTRAGVRDGEQETSPQADPHPHVEAPPSKASKWMHRSIKRQTRSQKGGGSFVNTSAVFWQETTSTNQCTVTGQTSTMNP